MTRLLRVRNLAIALLALTFAAAAHAQAMPTDSDAWRTRCNQFLDTGATPGPDSSGITAERFEQLARERSSHNQHFVACNLFLSAAGARSVENKSTDAKNDLSLAKQERKIGLGQKLSFTDRLTRGETGVVAKARPAAPPNTLEATAVNMLLTSGPGSTDGTFATRPSGSNSTAQFGSPSSGPQPSQGGGSIAPKPMATSMQAPAAGASAATSGFDPTALSGGSSSSPTANSTTASHGSTHHTARAHAKATPAPPAESPASPQ